jgi:hypothetical protein
MNWGLFTLLKRLELDSQGNYRLVSVVLLHATHARFHETADLPQIGPDRKEEDVMQRFLSVLCTIAVLALLMALVLPNPVAAQSKEINRAPASADTSGHPLHLNVDAASGHKVHVMPTPAQVKGVTDIGYQHNGGTPPLLYNGGPVMHSPKVYVIYWVPPKLQDGTATSLSSAYQTIETTMLKEYFGHSLMNNNTQYFDTKYITNVGSVAATYVDKSLYPGSDCYDPAVGAGLLTNGNNCISDTDLQNEVTKVMALKHWVGGVDNLFMVFTSSNEGQCAISDSDCSYYNYCAYHSYFVDGAGADVIYSNEPYGNTTVCQVSGAPSPNSNPDADAAATAAAHELTESITDPKLNAWLDSSGYEIGDECAYYYGVPLWDSGNATNQWDGHNFYIQTMYDNLAQGFYLTDVNFTGCMNVGPEL